MDWIYEIPTWQFGLLCALAAVVVLLIGTIFVRPILHALLRGQKDINSLVGNILACFCVFYGLLLGLVAVAAYQNAADVGRLVAEESGALTTLYRDISYYEEPHREELKESLREYTRFLIEEEWNELRKGQLPRKSTELLNDFQERLMEVEPETPGQEVLHAQTIGEFSHFIHVRRIRRHHVTAGIPAEMWAVVLLGALINIMLVWMFNARLLAQWILGGLLSFYIGSTIFLIAAMDRPFRGDLAVTPESFRVVYEYQMAEDAADEAEPEIEIEAEDPIELEPGEGAAEGSESGRDDEDE